MKCHYIYDKKAGKILIPGCMGTAAMGIHNCTCRPETAHYNLERERYNETVKALRADKKELEQENARLNRIIKKLLKHR